MSIGKITNCIRQSPSHFSTNLRLPFANSFREQAIPELQDFDGLPATVPQNNEAQAQPIQFGDSLLYDVLYTPIENFLDAL